MLGDDQRGPANLLGVLVSDENAIQSRAGIQNTTSVVPLFSVVRLCRVFALAAPFTCDVSQSVSVKQSQYSILCSILSLDSTAVLLAARYTVQK